MKAFSSMVLTGSQLLVVILTLIGFAAWALGLFEWPFSDRTADIVADLGTSLITGALITGAFVWLEEEREQARVIEGLRTQLRSSSELAGIALSNFDLSGLYLGGKNFTGADFSAAKMENTSFHRSILDYATFKDVDLTTVDLSESSVESTVFVRCVLPENFQKQVYGDPIITGEL